MDYNRNSFVMSFVRKFTAEVDGESKEFTRLYDLAIPLGANWEEIYGVLTEAIADVKKMEEDAKKRAEEIRAEKEKAESDKTSEVVA
jgi:hypothetical protein